MNEDIEFDVPVIEPPPLVETEDMPTVGGIRGIKSASHLFGAPNGNQRQPQSKERVEKSRRVTRTISHELEKVVTIKGVGKKKRQILAALLSDALIKGQVDFVGGRSITLNAKTWSDLMIRTVEHLDGRVDPRIDITNNVMASPMVVTTADLDALARIYARDITHESDGT